MEDGLRRWWFCAAGMDGIGGTGASRWPRYGVGGRAGVAEGMVLDSVCIYICLRDAPLDAQMGINDWGCKKKKREKAAVVVLYRESAAKQPSGGG